MNRLKEILKEINFFGAAKAIGLVFLFILAICLFVFILMFSIKLAALLATATVASWGYPLAGRM